MSSSIIVFCDNGHTKSKLGWFTRDHAGAWTAGGIHDTQLLTGLDRDDQPTVTDPVRYRLTLRCRRCSTNARFRWELFTAMLDQLAAADFERVSLAGITAVRRT